LELIEKQSTTILLTAFALLISAMVQTRMGLSAFDAVIVLSLSWMNNTNIFIYFLLYVQYKSQPVAEIEEVEDGGTRILVKPTWSSWKNHLWEQVLFWKGDSISGSSRLLVNFRHSKRR
jgi:hypothetical protein